MNFLFEIGTEELPNSLLLTTLDTMKATLEKFLKDRRIEFSDIETFTTPRRMTFLVHDLSENQTDLHLKVVGPKVEIAYDSTGALTKAGEGFLSKNGVSKEQLLTVADKKGECIALELFEKGKSTKEVLESELASVIESVPLKKSMFWSGSYKFLRPVRWVLAILGSEFLTLQIGAVKSGHTTRGIRVFSEGDLEVSSIENYFEVLKANHVIASLEERKAKILSSIFEIYPELKQKGYEIQYSDELLTEVANLVEYPYPIIGEFDKSFLVVPKEMLITTMQVHQRYFPILDADGELVNQFIIIRNGIENSDYVRTGNQKVVQARLADAKFFFEEDLKTPFSKFEHDLTNITFQKQLGQVSEKIVRMEKMASESIVEKVGANKEAVATTIKLCKADLASKVVNEKEYAYLQGKMGSIYARHHGISENVAVGIYEHYLPKFNSDAIPSNLEGAIASLTDRMDTLVGCFAIGMIPTGSQDPFALRRAAFGIVNIIRGFKMDISLSSLVECSLSLYEKQGVALAFSHAEIVEKVLEYIKQRVVNVLASEFSEKIVKACVSISSDNLLDLISRIDAVERSYTSGKFEAVEAMIKRIENILKKAKFSAKNIDTSLFEVEAEKALYTLYTSESSKVERAIVENNYVEAIEHLEKFADTVSNYFENVMINAEDATVRENRQLMLTAVYQLFNRLVDVKELA